MLQEVHVEVVVAPHRLLYPQLKDVGEVTGGVKPQIHNRVSNAGGATGGGGLERFKTSYFIIHL